MKIIIFLLETLIFIFKSPFWKCINYEWTLNISFSLQHRSNLISCFMSGFSHMMGIHKVINDKSSEFMLINGHFFKILHHYQNWCTFVNNTKNAKVERFRIESISVNGWSDWSNHIGLVFYVLLVFVMMEDELNKENSNAHIWRHTRLVKIIYLILKSRITFKNTFFRYGIKTNVIQQVPISTLKQLCKQYNMSSQTHTQLI